MVQCNKNAALQHHDFVIDGAATNAALGQLERLLRGPQ
jgi:hypothetical protein